MATEGARDYRPAFHYTPEKGWINDPNGLVFDGEKYHLFAQYYPDDTKWGPMHWAHAVSSDMLRWEHLPVALYPDKLGMCFSGSACMINGKIALMYTSHGDMERQSVAFTEDGESFVPYIGNPVIDNNDKKDYRDPKLFYNDTLGKYGVAVAAGEHVEFFASDDLIKWEKTGEFSDQARVTGIHECPDMFPITTPDGEVVYVMVASMITPDCGNRTQYVLGDFDGRAFRITKPFDRREWIDAGWDNYAPVTYWGTDKKIMIGWASNWKYADRLPTGDYCGAMTFPRELGIIDTNRGLRLTQKPLIDSITGEYSVCDELPGNKFRVRVRAQGDFTLTLYNDGGEKLVFGLQGNEYFVDRRFAGECGGATEITGDYGVARRERYISGDVEMDIAFDVSIAEAFADNGTWAATTTVYPVKPYTHVKAEDCTFEIAELAFGEQ